MKLRKYNKRANSKALNQEVSGYNDSTYMNENNHWIHTSKLNDKILYLKKRLESTSVIENRINNKSRLISQLMNLSNNPKNTININTKNKVKIIIKKSTKEHLNNTIGQINDSFPYN